MPAASARSAHAAIVGTRADRAWPMCSAPRPAPCRRPRRAGLRARRLGALFLGHGARAVAQRRRPIGGRRRDRSSGAHASGVGEAATHGRAPRASASAAWLVAAGRSARRRCARRRWSALHVVPEFLGNRAPFADPDARALIAGLEHGHQLDSLVALYRRRRLRSRLRRAADRAGRHDKGIPIDTIVVSGGAGQSPSCASCWPIRRALTVAASTSPEPVLLGSAMLGAVAAGRIRTLPRLCRRCRDRRNLSAQPHGAEWHEKRFEAFEMLQQTARTIRDGKSFRASSA